jgi:hypothetical protein
MTIVGGLDIHRKHLTFDYPGTVTGEVRRGQIAPTLWLGVAGWRRRGRGRFGEPCVQPCPDLLWGVGAAAAFCPCDHDPGGRDTCEGGQAEYFPPAHLPRLRLCLARASAWMRPSR